jgi:large subunit ribosomal protein L21e
MVSRIGTKQRKTRHKLTNNYRARGKVSLSRYFASYQAGDTVNLKLHPSVQKGRFFPRFHGLSGKISGSMKGDCYEVTINDGGKRKALFVHPIHMKKA